MDADQHASGVNVGRLQPNDLADAQAGRVSRQEEYPMLEKRSAREESSHFVSTEHKRKLARLAGNRDIEVRAKSSECPVIEEAQGRDGDVAGARRAFLLQMYIIEGRP